MISKPEYLDLEQAAAIAPGNPSPHSVWRWARRGAKLKSGGVLRLQHIRRCGKLFTTEAWLTELFKELAADDVREFAKHDREVPVPAGRR